MQLEADVSSDADCRRLAEAAIQRFGRIYGLVDASGRMLNHCEYESLSVGSRRKLAIAWHSEGKYGILILEGTVLVPFEWELMAARIGNSGSAV